MIANVRVWVWSVPKMVVVAELYRVLVAQAAVL
jgi:hypothetical protein